MRSEGKKPKEIWKKQKFHTQIPSVIAVGKIETGTENWKGNCQCSRNKGLQFAFILAYRM